MTQKIFTPDDGSAEQGKLQKIDIYEMLNRILAQDRKLDKLEMELQNYKANNTESLNNLVIRHEKFEEHFEKTFDQLTESLAGIDKKLAIFIETSVKLDSFKQRVISMTVTLGLPVVSLIVFLLHNYFKHK